MLVLTLLAHAAALHGSSFTYDDHPIVEQNPRLDVRGWADLRRLVATDYWNDPSGGERLWRPLPLLTFALERRLHGGDPDLFRLANVLLHGAIAVASLPLFAALCGSRRLSLLGALLFALHPVHAEVTAGIVGRSELLGLGLVLLAFLAHRAGMQPGRGGGARALLVLAAGLCFFLALTAKEIAATGPFLLLLFQAAARVGPGRDAASRQRQLREAAALAAGGAPPERALQRLRRLPRWLARAARVAAPWLVYLLAIGLYVLLRKAVLGDVVARASARTLGGLDLLDRAVFACQVYLDSLLSLLLPHPTSAHYPLGGAWLDPLTPGLTVPAPDGGTPVPSWGRPLAVPLLLLNAALLLGVWRGLRGGARAPRLVATGLFGFYLALGPVSNLLVPIGVLRADRLLYTPSWWACLSLAALAASVSRALAPTLGPRWGWALIAAALVGPYAGLLSWNAATWSDERRLWERSYARHPDEPRIQVALAQVWLHDPQGLPRAEALLRQAVEATPPAAPMAGKARALLGSCLVTQPGQEAQAEQLLVEARSLLPDSPLVFEGLTTLYLQRAQASTDSHERGRWVREAVRTLKEGTRVTRDPNLWLLLGNLLALIGRGPEAEAAYGQAIELSVAPRQALLKRARLREAQGDAAAALEDVRRLCEIPAGRAPEEAAQLLPPAMSLRAELAARLGLADEARVCQEWLRARGSGP